MAADLRPEAPGDHVDRLYRAAWALCGNRRDADILVEGAYAQVLSAPRRLAQDDDLGDLVRTLRQIAVSSPGAKDQLPQDVGTDADVLPGGEVFAAISELPAELRDAVVAVDVAGLSYAEAADALRIKQGTVISRCSRGRGRLADRLA